MRLRNIPGADEALENSLFVIKKPEEHRGRWKKDVFQNEHPLYIEIGCGKGLFLTTLAQNNPDINYIGIEKMSSVLLRAVQKQDELQLQNLKFMRIDAERLEEIFEENEVDRIYLNFSDPWPKDRHAKRRLTSREFLKRYEHILSKDAVIEFKTDNRNLFDFSVEEVKEAGWHTELVTYDLHHSEYLDGNVMTEYEDRFVTLGNKIMKMIISRP